MFKRQNKNKLIIIGAIIILALTLVLFAKQPVFAQDKPAATSTTSTTTTPPPESTTPTTPQSPAADTGTNDNSLVDQAASGALAIFVIAIGMVISAVTSLFGDLLVVLIEILVWISGYNSFINNDYVKQGWVILRDLVNMFFVLGLLFIAFVTVLKIEKYQWNKLLARLLIMAIVVNFSKTICGIIIDFFQVLMMTFVNAYKDIAAGNLMNSVGVTHWWQLSKQVFSTTYIQGQGSASVQLKLLAGQMLALIFTLVLCIVVVIFVIILAARIIALWILIVFSPLAFFSWIFEGSIGKLGEFSRQWWGQFLNYCMVGPFLAFFLWISVLTMAKMDPNNMVSSSYYNIATRNTTEVTASLSEGSSMTSVIKYMMVIIMLVGGLSQTQRFSVVGAGLAVGAANWMKDQSVGRIERGARKVGAGAAGLAKAPYTLAVKPRMAGMAEGISQRLQRGDLGTIAGKNLKVPAGLSKLLTKAGREESMRQRQAGYQKRYAGGGLDKLKTDMDIASKQDNLHPDVNLKNATQVDKELEKMKDENGDWKGGIDKRWLMRLTMAKADLGKLEYSDVNDLNKKGGTLDGMDKRERQVFLEDMEDRYMKETGRMKAFGSLVYNEETNQYDDVTDLEDNAVKSMQTQGIAQDKLNDIPISKVVRKITDKNDASFGEYRLDENSADFKKLDQSQQDMLRNLQAQGTHYDREHPEAGENNSDFYNVIRYGDVIEKKQGEVRKKMATSNKEQFNKASKQADMGDPTKNDIYTGVEMDGGVKQLSRVSGLDQGGRDNWVAKIGTRFAKGEDRMKLIEGNKQWFGKDLQRKDEEIISATDSDAIKKQKNDNYTNRIDKVYERMDKETDSMGEDQLKEYQDFYKEATAKYDDFGRKKEDGVSNQTLDKLILDKRQKEGIASKVSSEVDTLLPPNKKAAAPQAKKFINSEAAEMLAVTEDQDRATRKKTIAQRIQTKTILDQDEAETMADYVIDNEVKIKALDKEIKGEKGKVTISLKTIFNEANKQFRGKKETDKVAFMVQSLIGRLKNRIQSSAMPEEVFALGDVEKELKDLTAQIGAAKNQKQYDDAVKNLRNALKSLGYDVGGGEKKTP